jgi:hypothetical protein
MTRVAEGVTTASRSRMRLQCAEARLITTLGALCFETRSTPRWRRGTRPSRLAQPQAEFIAHGVVVRIGRRTGVRCAAFARPKRTPAAPTDGKGRIPSRMQLRVRTSSAASSRPLCLNKLAPCLDSGSVIMPGGLRGPARICTTYSTRRRAIVGGGLVGIDGSRQLLSRAIS